MRIGIPKERKVLEGRVALTPSAVHSLVARGHEVWVESGAGLKSGFQDAAYLTSGAKIAADDRQLYAESVLIVKVKEPLAEDLQYLRVDHILFCFLHLAADRQLTEQLMHLGVTAIGFETVMEADGSLPILAPMSMVAGHVAVQLGVHFLGAPQGGKGILLGGIASTRRGRVVILGGGVAGGRAARHAAALGAEVLVFDRKPSVREQLREVSPLITTYPASQDLISEALRQADLLVGAVLVPGARAPQLVDRDMVALMEPGSVIVDIAVDQGGCIETIRPTSYDQPSYVDEGVIHLGVTNLPGAVPRTSTEAISAAIMPYLQQLAESPEHPGTVLHGAINIKNGQALHPAIADWLSKSE